MAIEEALPVVRRAGGVVYLRGAATWDKSGVNIALGPRVTGGGGLAQRQSDGGEGGQAAAEAVSRGGSGRGGGQAAAAASRGGPRPAAVAKPRLHRLSSILLYLTATGMSRLQAAS
uniref:Uncharacterized protein n=1 Tax=Oryza sativa subsp. japonica TaxID=39947 RepID=Q5Z5P6_ORYSJ|nr:hypothetical protein [Oryza sativa Japonica Group]